jgi:hypothetical protein
MKKLLLIFIFTVLFLVPSTDTVNAQTGVTNCSNRYATLVNPVRGRDLWADKSLNPLIDQYSAISQKGMPATWLFQYDALTDSELIQEVKRFSPNQEMGVFLEVSRPLAEKAKVPYLETVRWSSPAIVFLSAYSIGGRKLLIDEMMSEFKKDFGYYPKSVGAWWIDSYSLDYLTSRYGVTSAMIVADQKTTDQYGVWGQWWGVPYYPSKLDILAPAKDASDKANVVITQWAQRDLTQAEGLGPSSSNNSLQANDYIRQGKNTTYFSGLLSEYFDCRNKVSQVTVGLETGMESVGFLNEYINQLNLLSHTKDLQIVTMSDFSDAFKKVYPGIVDGYVLGNNDQAWQLTPQMRENKFLGDEATYPSGVVFSDYFVKDSSDFLKRYVQDLSGLKDSHYLPYWILAFAFVALLIAKKTNWKYAIALVCFTFFSFNLIFLSFEKYGWQVFYGLQIHDLVIVQMALTLIPLLLYLGLKKIKYVYLLPLTFGLDYFVLLFKYAQLYGFYYFGNFWQKTYFIGIKVSEKLSGINFVGQNFEINRANNFLAATTIKILSTSILAAIMYPLVHILLAYIIFRLPVKIRKVIVIILAVLTLGFIYNLIKLEPRSVLPILK